MSALFKDIYSFSFYENFCGILSKTLPSFDKEEFLTLIFDENFQTLELKERMTHTAKVLHCFLPPDFCKAVKVIKQIILNLQHSGVEEASIEFMFLPEYIALYGIDHYEDSVAAIEFVTQFTSCEFAVRPFILKYEEKMLRQMLIWSNHSNNKVRRLASEGSRPRLPWAMAIPFLKKDPTPILPILENLRLDDCEIVRRSVANNLNDISKDNPQIVIDLAIKWQGISKETDAIIKHACRTLLKKAHPEIMNYYGLDSDSIKAEEFFIKTPVVKIGENLEFSFSVSNQTENPKIVRLEYGLYYKKNNGNNAKKVFKISERAFKPFEKSVINRKQSFRLITTRKFYEGEHKLSIIINGKEKSTLNFELLLE